jgi:hypothetical protein
MSEDKSNIAKEKLAKMIDELRRAAQKIGELAKTNPDQDDQLALGVLNDKAALYLQDILLMVADDRNLDIPTVIEFIDLVEHFVAQVDEI